MDYLEPGGNGTLQGRFINADVDASETVAEFSVDGLTWLAVEVNNATAAGTATLTAFAINLKTHDQGNYVTTHSGATDYSTPILPLTKCFGAPVTLAENASALLLFELNMMFSHIKITAAGASSYVTLFVRGG